MSNFEPRVKNYRSSYGGVGSSRLGMGGVRGGSRGGGRGFFDLPPPPPPKNEPQRNLSQRYYHHKGKFGKAMYKPNVPYLKAAKLLGRALGIGLKVNPYLKLINISYNVAYALDEFMPWIQYQPATPGIFYPGDGWDLICRNDLPEDSYNTFSSKTVAELCGIPLQVPWAPLDPDGGDLLARSGSQFGSIITYYTTTGSPTTSPWRGTVVACWQRGSRPRVTEPYPYAAYNPKPAVVYPTLGYGAPPKPMLQESTSGYPSGPPRTPPYVMPAAVWPIGSAPKPGRHLRVPPYYPHKEKKGNASLRQALAVLSKGYGGVTEMNDAVNAIYDALGKKCGAKGMVAKTECIYRNLGTLDVAQAIRNLAINHYTDKYAGRIFGAAGKHSPFGVMTNAMKGPSPF